MNPRKSILIVATLACALVLPTVQAARVYLSPALQAAPLTDGTTTLELFMDFTGDPTLGGGIDLALSGPISIASFTPSAYFTGGGAGPDPFFSGFGAIDADADFEVHFGNFAGLGGLNKLGDLTLNLLGVGLGEIAMNINSTFGEFFDLDSLPQTVSLEGASVDINAVPVPAAVWFFGSALGLLGGFRRMSKK